MIEINLLPEYLRKSEGTPLPRQLTIYLGVAVCMVLIFSNWFYFNEIGKSEKQLRNVENELSEVGNKIQKLETLIAEIAVIKTRVGAVEGLYRKRVIWAKVLADLKHILNEQNYNESSDALEYLWFDSLKISKSRGGAFGMSGSNKPTQYLKLTGFASARGTRKATKMVRDLVRTMVIYKPVKKPESEALESLENELKLREQRERDRRKKGRKKKLGEKELRERKAVEEYRRHLMASKSGGIATRSFMSYFEQSTRSVKTSWMDKSGDAAKEEISQKLPQSKMKFEISLGFKPEKKAPQAGF